jgi:hypothetical protein
MLFGKRENFCEGGKVKSAKWMIWALLLILAASGCYWMPEQGGVAVAFSVPKELLAKASPDLYTATLTFEEAAPNETTGEWEAEPEGVVYKDSVVVPAFELISQGAMAIKMHSGHFMLSIVLEPPDPAAGTVYKSDPAHVLIPVASLAKVDVVLRPL